ncbi:MAG: alpha/beta hydrolase [Gammaproteobacteria bacterium]|nr:alpha/beta hydrolase [Gammaproteobacteria bacterium]
MSDIDPYLEQQYNNRAAVAEHPRFLQSWAERSQAYRAQADAWLDIAYGESERQTLDIFPAAGGADPVHVFIHGGYWQALSKDSFSYVAQHFNRAGECAVIVNYDLCPQVALVEIIHQLHRALGWILQHIHRYGGDAGRIQVTGHSAGGHLLAELLTHDWSHDAVAGKRLQHPPFQRLNALSGLYQLTPLVQTSINQALGLDPASAEECSPLQHPLWQPAAATELNLLVGQLESDEYKRQSSELQQAWQPELQLNYQQLPGVHHFSIVDAFVEQHYQSLAAV